MTTTYHPAVQSLIDVFDAKGSVALGLSVAIIWIIVIVVRIRARHIAQKDMHTTVVAQYDPPADISPLMSYFLHKKGVTGVKLAGDLTDQADQLLALMYFYEKEILTKFEYQEDESVLIEIDPKYAERLELDEDKAFFDLFFKHNPSLKTGIEITLKPMRQGKQNQEVVGYLELHMMWFDFNSTLRSLAIKQGYITNAPKLVTFLATWTDVSLLIGVFASVFILIAPGFIAFAGILFVLFALKEMRNPHTRKPMNAKAKLFVLCMAIMSVLILFVPEVRIWTIGLLVMPFLFIFALSYVIVSGLMHIDSLVSTIQSISAYKHIFVMVLGISWFAWLLLYIKPSRALLSHMTDKGRDMLVYLEGYKKFLKTVDMNRISMHSSGDINPKVWKTSFVWLLIFNIADYDQFDIWMELQGKNAIATSTAFGK